MYNVCIFNYSFNTSFFIRECVRHGLYSMRVMNIFDNMKNLLFILI